MDILLDTVRDEIGACLETSYDQISVKEAQNRLNFKTDKEMLAFGDKVSIICIGQTLTDLPSVIYVHYYLLTLSIFIFIQISTEKVEAECEKRLLLRKQHGETKGAIAIFRIS